MCIRMKSGLSSSLKSFGLSCGYWSPRPKIPFPIYFDYIWVSWDFYFGMALILLLLSCDVSASNDPPPLRSFLHCRLCMEVYWPHLSVVVRRVMFGKITPRFVVPGFQITRKWSCLIRSWIQKKHSSLDFDNFWYTILFAMPCAVELSVCIGVSLWVCPILFEMVRIGSAYWKIWKKDPTSASVPDTIAFFIVLDTVCSMPFVSLVFLKFWGPINKHLPDMIEALIPEK